MITVGRCQQEAFKKAALVRFRQRVYQDIKEDKSQRGEAFAAGSLLALVNRAIDNALHYGLTSEKAIFSFVLCTLDFGEHFTLQHWLLAPVFSEHKGDEVVLCRYLKLALA